MVRANVSAVSLGQLSMQIVKTRTATTLATRFTTFRKALIGKRKREPRLHICWLSILARNSNLGALSIFLEQNKVLPVVRRT